MSLAPQPVHLVVLVDPSVASTARVSADSAYTLARANSNNATIDAAQLDNSHGRLVYDIVLMDQNSAPVEVVVDAMNGQVLDATTYGGLKAQLDARGQLNRGARRDSMRRDSTRRDSTRRDTTNRKP